MCDHICKHLHAQGRQKKNSAQWSILKELEGVWK